MHRSLRFLIVLAFLFSASEAFSFCEWAFVNVAGKTGSQYISFSDDASDCPNISSTATIPQGGEDAYVSGRVGQGFNVAKVFNSGELASDGRRIVEGVKAILAGPARTPDVEGARQRSLVIETLSKTLRAYESKLIQDLEKRNDNIEKITIKTSMEFREWEIGSEASKKLAVTALLNAQNQADFSAGIIVTSSDAFALSQAALNLNQEQFEALKRGALSPGAITSLQNSIEQELKSFSSNKKLDQLNGLLTLISNEKNEYRKRQYLNLLASVVDQNGLVKQWQGQIGQGFSLSSQSSDPYGVKARNSMNLIMGSLVASIEKGSADEPALRNLRQNLRLIEGADDAATYGSTYDKLRGQRHINSGYALAAFETNSSLADQLKKTVLAAGSSDQFPALKDFGKVTSYESYVIVNAVNQFINAGAGNNNSYASFYARSFVDKALAAMSLRDVPGFQAAVDGLQSLTDFKKGITEGVLIGGIDTVEGLWHLVTSPLESAQALYSAVVHYDRTYGVIRDLIGQTISEMPNWDAQKWGQFEGRISFEVGSALVGAKIFDTVADLGKVSNLSLGLGELGSGVSGATEKALSLGLSGADEIAEFTEVSTRLGLSQSEEFSRLERVVEYSSNPISEAIPMDLHLIGQGDRAAAAAGRIAPVDGKFDMIIHGWDEGFAVLHNGEEVAINHRDVARFMSQNGWDGQTPVRLVSCRTGACDTGAARNLANKLGVEVSAPSDTLWVHANGRMTIGPDPSTNSGTWRVFKPGE